MKIDDRCYMFTLSAHSRMQSRTCRKWNWNGLGNNKFLWTKLIGVWMCSHLASYRRCLPLTCRYIWGRANKIHNCIGSCCDVSARRISCSPTGSVDALVYAIRFACIPLWTPIFACLYLPHEFVRADWRLWTVPHGTIYVHGCVVILLFVVHVPCVRDAEINEHPCRPVHETPLRLHVCRGPISSCSWSFSRINFLMAALPASGELLVTCVLR